MAKVFRQQDLVQIKRQHTVVTGVRAGGKLKPTINEVRIFPTKFNPGETEADIKAYITDILDLDCKVERIKSRTKRHSSFILTACKKYEQVLLDPNSWKEGVEVRHFYGRLRTSAEQSSASGVRNE